jgi:hypothetical protein
MRDLWQWTSLWACRLWICPILLYQRLASPLLPRSCRFVPTCSQYAIIAVERHGIAKGTALAFWRVLRCNPFCRGGYDPVPPTRHETHHSTGEPVR